MEGESVTPQAAGARGRPRDPLIAARLLAAAVDELAARGIAAFSTNSVAARAGVDKRGIYSRWPDRDDLILAAFGTLTAGLMPPRTGNLRGDLEALVPDIAAVFTSPRREILQRCLDESRDYPELAMGFRRDCAGLCAAVVEDAFHRARSRGELDPATTPARATEVLMGMFLARALLVDDEAARSATAQQAIVEQALHMLGRSSPGR